MLDKLLQNLGLNEKEILIISALLDSGKLTAQSIARKTNLPRTTIYGLVNRLVEVGIVTCDLSERSVSYAIADARVFTRYVDKEHEQVLKKRESVEQLERILDVQLKEQAFLGPRVASAEGRKEVENLLFEFRPKWRDSYKRINHFTMWGYQDHQFVDAYRRWHEHAWSIREPLEEVRLFSTPEGVAQQKRDGINRRQLRLLPPGLQFSSTVWVHGEYLLLGVVTEEPHRVMIMHDRTLTANFRSLFQWLWKMTDPDNKKF